MNARYVTHLFVLTLCFAVHLFFFIHLFIDLPRPALLGVAVIIGGACFYFKVPSMLDSKLSYFLTAAQILLPIVYTFHRDWPQVILIMVIAAFIEVTRFTYKREQNVAIQKTKHLENALEAANQTFLDLRHERHDYMKHISALQFLLEKEAYEDSRAYMKDLVDSYEHTHEAIKGEESAIGAILYQSKKLAEHKNVRVSYSLETTLSTLPLPLREKSAIIGNILGNAIDAAANFAKEKRVQANVKLEFQHKQGFYILLCKNDTLHIPNAVLDHLFQKQGMTTKNGSHEGLGTMIIRQIVDQHVGYLDFTYKRENFTLKIKLPAVV